MLRLINTYEDKAIAAEFFLSKMGDDTKGASQRLMLPGGDCELMLEPGDGTFIICVEAVASNNVVESITGGA